jgi:hypothetical protein
MKLFWKSLITQWILFNYLGWLLGLIAGPILFLILIISLFIWPNEFWDNILMPIFLSFPLGVSIGAMQNIVIQRWNMPISFWVLISLLSSITTTALTILFFHVGVFGNDIGAIYLAPCLAGLILAVFQTASLRKLISRPLLWAISYIGGLFIGIVAIFFITGLAFATADSIVKVLYSLELWDVVIYRDDVLIISNLLFTFPLSLAIIIGLPTGIILQRNLATSKTG